MQIDGSNTRGDVLRLRFFQKSQVAKFWTARKRNVRAAFMTTRDGLSSSADAAPASVAKNNTAAAR